MSYSKLLTDINNLSQAPVTLPFLVDWFISNGYQDKITFTPASMDDSKLMGYIKRYSGIAPPYADVPWLCEIVYASSLNDCWRRFICCKELMHLFDRSADQVKTHEDLSRLLEELALIPVSSAAPADLSSKTIADNAAYQRALMALCPMKFIEQMRPAYSTKERSNRQIAFFLKIPEAFIDIIFDKDFVEVYRESTHPIKEIKSVPVGG